MRILGEITKVNILKTVSFLCIVSCFIILPSFSWTVSPVRFEVKGERGKEYTFAFSVLNESQLYEKRFEIMLDDWIIDKENNFLRKAFNKEIKIKNSAKNWIKATPMHFVLPPGETKNIRFTVSIPEDVPSDGEYSTGIFVGEKNIDKPPKGEKVIHIKQDTFIGVIVYVKVGKEKHDVTLTNLKVKSEPLGNGLNHVVLLPVFKNNGNVHARANLKIKMEKLSNDLKVIKTKAEVVNKKNSKSIKNTKAESKSIEGGLEIPEEFEGGEAVVLRESEIIFPVSIPVPIPSGTEWKFTVRADFGNNIPLIIGKKTYKVPDLDLKKEKEANLSKIN